MVSVLRLTVDELALIFANSGHVDAAYQLLASSIARQLTADELQGRLSAAANALVRVGLAEIIGSDKLTLAPVLFEVGKVLMTAQSSLRFTLSQPGQQWNLTYHFLDGKIYEHWIERGLTHVISRVEKAVIFEGCQKIFELERFQSSSVQGKIEHVLLREVTRQKQVSAALDLLRNSSIPESGLQALAEDAVHTSALGDVLAVTYEGTERRPVADNGLFFIFGQQRYWMFRPAAQDDGTVVLHLLPSDSNSLQVELDTLISYCQRQAA